MLSLLPSQGFYSEPREPHLKALGSTNTTI